MLRRLILALLAFALAVGLPLQGVLAQDKATLIADKVEVDGNSRLMATGNVEVFYQGRRIRASSIVYDQAAERLEIAGPIVLQDGTGTLVLASQASLDDDLSNGILQSARLVLNQQLQLAASQLMRVGGRYTVLGRTVASSCQVCAANPVPLWEIRARRVVHDAAERQIYFDHAQLRFGGIPVIYLPRLRMPDPSLKRSTGFLTPSIRTTSGLGNGIKVPYFITLGDSRDLTLSPYITTKGGRTLEARYRQAFRTGQIDLTGALSYDEIRRGEARGFIVATGGFVLPRDFLLSFRLETVSDPAYLLDYGISGKDRIDSRVEITRTRRDQYISGRLVHYNSIRAGEANSTLPTLVSDLTYRQRFRPGLLGGAAGVTFQTHSDYRASRLGIDSDGDGVSDGRDLSRASVKLDWRRNWVLPAGLVGSVLGELRTDAYSIEQDAVWQGQTTRTHGAAAVELRWPLVRTGPAGVTQVIEPVAQLVWSPRDEARVPNEDSTLVEFDEGNLFSLSRFPGSDATERGLRANLGVSWTRSDPQGWSMGVTAGRVIRADDLGQFSAASGLEGASSDWLTAVQFSLDQGLLLTNRLIFDDGFDVTKAEMRLDMSGARYGLSSSYVWVVADATENRFADTSELTADASYAFTPAWRGRFSGRYDFEADRAAAAGLGLQFRNECLQVDLSLSRRFTSSTSVEPTTDFGLSVDLLGFGSGTAAGPARVCRR